MRLVGKLDDEDQARTFSDYLTQLEIDNQVALEPDGVCEIWIISEDDVKHAEQLLAKFLETPGSEEYKDVSGKAKKVRRERQKEERRRGPEVDVRTKVFGRKNAPQGSLTLFLIIVSVVVALFSGLGKNYQFLSNLYITNIDGAGVYHLGLPEILSGQFWRLITPIFIHFGPIHLLFNMLWLKDLGSMIEDRKGVWFLGIFVVVNAVAGNLFQYLILDPGFGGMSGVIYGLLGYAWMKSKYDPNAQIYLHKTTVVMMIGWFFLCLTGLMGPIANGAHGAGLVIGVIWGYVTSPHIKKLI